MYNNNQNYYGQPIGGSYGGYRPQYPIQQRKIINNNTLLSPEEMKRIQKDSNEFNLNISPIEYLKSACVHRDQSGQLTIDPDDNESVKCRICGKSFKLLDLSDEEIVNKIIDEFVSLGETIKLSYVDIPSQMREYFKFLPFVEKFRQLTQIALKSYDNYAKQNNIQSYGSNQSLAYRYHNIYNQPYFRGVSPNAPYQNNFAMNSYNQQPYEIFIGNDNIQYARYADGTMIPLNQQYQQPHDQNYSVNNDYQYPSVFNNQSHSLYQQQQPIYNQQQYQQQPIYNQQQYQQPVNSKHHIATDVNGDTVKYDPVTGNQIK